VHWVDVNGNGCYGHLQGVRGVGTWKGDSGGGNLKDKDGNSKVVFEIMLELQNKFTHYNLLWMSFYRSNSFTVMHASIFGIHICRYSIII
jgi:hypothetical protein